MSDVYSKEKRSDIMSRVKNKKTKPEEEFAKILRKEKIKYRRYARSLPGNPDFIIAESNLVVFIHGCFWHGHHNCRRATIPKTNRKFWTNKISGNKRRDIRVARQLRNLGWHVMTVWQCHFRSKDRIVKKLQRMANL